MLTGELPQKKIATGYASDIILRATNLAPWERYNSVKDLEKDIQKEKITAITLFDKIISYIPGFRSKNIFKLAIALVFYLFAFSSQVILINYIIKASPKEDAIFSLVVLFLSYVYIFMFFAFLVNWCNIADKFCRPIKNKYLRRIVPALTLFVTASCVIFMIYPLKPQAFFMANPVVFLLNTIFGMMADAVFSIFNIT